MRIKSYFARAVEDAIAQARQEMGEDAMLVRTRRSLPDSRHLGEYEVVFAADVPDEAEADCSVAALPGAGSAAPNRLSLEIADVKRELEGMRHALMRSALASMQRPGASADAASAYAALVGAEVHPDLARELVEASETRVPGSKGALGSIASVPERERFQQALAQEIETRITVQPDLGRGNGRMRIIALVGPPGAGKTTTLVKLAVNFGLASRRPALLLSMDTYRIAAADQLRSYASILGLGCQILETTTALAQAIEENGGKDLILIDTPGLGPGELDAATGLGRFLTTRSDIDTHLVLPASMKSADLTRAAAGYEVFGPQKLLFTKLDETGSFGPILNQAAQTGKALSFFTTGQRIPEDLETATRRRVVELVLAGSSGERASATLTAA